MIIIGIVMYFTMWLGIYFPKCHHHLLHLIHLTLLLLPSKTLANIVCFLREWAVSGGLWASRAYLPAQFSYLLSSMIRCMSSPPSFHLPSLTSLFIEHICHSISYDILVSFSPCFSFFSLSLRNYVFLSFYLTLPIKNPRFFCFLLNICKKSLFLVFHFFLSFLMRKLIKMETYANIHFLIYYLSQLY